MPEETSAGSYDHYLQISELLKLQRMLSDPPHHDEMLFIIIHQIHELWFKQMLHELDTIISLMLDARVLQAVRLCRRLAGIQKVLLAQMDVLETMAAQDFAAFRNLLNPASGFQSFQFRALEFRSGLKNPKYVAIHHSDPEAQAMLNAALAAPSLNEAWAQLLRNRGLEYPPPPAASSEAGDLTAEDRRIRTLRTLYEQPEDHYDLYILAEALLDYDENFLLWRRRHVLMVERMIGAKRGTGGSDGVAYLLTTLDQRCFPELWAVRTHLLQGVYGRGA